MFRHFATSLLVLALGTPLAHADSKTDRTRERATEARAVVDADARGVDAATQRVDALRVSWDRAVANDHPDEAGRLAVAHFDALVARRHAEAALRNARANLETLREQMISDEYAEQTR